MIHQIRGLFPAVVFPLDAPFSLALAQQFLSCNLHSAIHLLLKFSSDINAARSSADYKIYCFFLNAAAFFMGQF